MSDGELNHRSRVCGVIALEKQSHYDRFIMEYPVRLREYAQQKPEILAVYLFGSRAQGGARLQSDTDIAILLMPHIAKQHYLDYRLRLMEDLSVFFAGRLDVVILNQVSPLLQFQVLKTGRLLYERSADCRAELEMQLLSRYYDARRYYEFHFSRLMDKIKQKGLGYGRSGDTSQAQEAR